MSQNVITFVLAALSNSYSSSLCYWSSLLKSHSVAYKQDQSLEKILIPKINKIMWLTYNTVLQDVHTKNMPYFEGKKWYRKCSCRVCRGCSWQNRILIISKYLHHGPTDYVGSHNPWIKHHPAMYTLGQRKSLRKVVFLGNLLIYSSADYKNYL